MKKAYMTPRAAAVELFAEEGFMLTISDTTKGGSQALTNKRNCGASAWDSSNWSEEPAED